MLYRNNIPIILLALFTGKLLILNTWSFESSITLIALAAVVSIFHWRLKDNEYTEIKALVIEQNKEIEELKKQNESVKNHLAGLRMAAGIKSTQVVKSF